MRKLLVVVCMLAAPALAQEMTLAAAKEKGATRLAKQDLEKIMPRAGIRISGSDSERTWTNAPDGKLNGFVESRAGAGTRGRGTGTGTWRITDDGRYCVDIEWNRGKEDWCRVLYRMGNHLVGFRRDTDDALADRRLFLE